MISDVARSFTFNNVDSVYGDLLYVDVKIQIVSEGIGSQEIFKLKI